MWLFILPEAWLQPRLQLQTWLTYPIVHYTARGHNSEKSGSPRSRGEQLFLCGGGFHAPVLASSQPCSASSFRPCRPVVHAQQPRCEVQGRARVCTREGLHMQRKAARKQEGELHDHGQGVSQTLLRKAPTAFPTPDNWNPNDSTWTRPGVRQSIFQELLYLHIEKHSTWTHFSTQGSRVCKQRC